jgi:hypothetical protein
MKMEMGKRVKRGRRCPLGGWDQPLPKPVCGALVERVLCVVNVLCEKDCVSEEA